MLKSLGKMLQRGIHRRYQWRHGSFFKPDSCVCLAPHHLSHCCQVQHKLYTHKHIHCRQSMCSHTTYKLPKYKHLFTAHMLTDSAGKILLSAELFKKASTL